MEPYVQPSWDVTYFNNDTGARQVIRVGAEGRSEAINAASPRVQGIGPWYFERAERAPS